jgi:hypothetical protein
MVAQTLTSLLESYLTLCFDRIHFPDMLSILEQDVESHLSLSSLSPCIHYTRYVVKTPICFGHRRSSSGGVPY